jgi:hypothetical protein
MKKLFLFLLIFLQNLLQAQATLTVSNKFETLPARADLFVGRDKFGSLYFITDNTLSMKKGNNTLDYKNLSKGTISHVDIDNPLLIMVFYENFNSIVLLDDQLNEIRQINFNNPDFEIQAHAAGIASQNRLWIFDNLKQQLLLYDYNNGSAHSLATFVGGNIHYYQSDYNYFQWVDEHLNHNAIDVYGKIFTLGKVPEFEQCSFVSDTVFLYSMKGKLYVYNSALDASTAIAIEEKTFKSFYYKDQILSIFTNQGISNYKITLP